MNAFNVKKHSTNELALMNVDTNVTGKKKQEVENIFQ